MCNPWKRTFNLVPLAPLTMISPLMIKFWLDMQLMNPGGLFMDKYNLKKSTQEDE
jgi:hypothetical protein